MNGGSRTAPRCFEAISQIRTHRIGHPHVGHDAVAEERRGPAPRPVEELVGDDEVEGPDILPHAPHGADRDHPLDAQRLEAVDVGAEVQLRGHEPVAPAVAGQKNHGPDAEPADAVGVRRVAERGLDPGPADIGEALQLVEPASSDDADPYLGGGLRPPSDTSPHRLRRRSRRSNTVSAHATTSPRVRSGVTSVTVTSRKRPTHSSGPSKKTST